jgi:hypothetical protein
MQQECCLPCASHRVSSVLTNSSLGLAWMLNSSTNVNSDMHAANGKTSNSGFRVLMFHRLCSWECRKEADAARAHLQQGGAQEQQLEGELRTVRTRCAALRDDLRNQQSGSAVAKALMEAKASGQIPGVLGRLGDLGAIDKQ